MSNKIDLNTCVKGQQLKTSLGMIVTYIGPTPMLGFSYLDHVIQYPNGSYGTRTSDGYVFLKNRKPETDHDIIEILDTVINLNVQN